MRLLHAHIHCSVMKRAPEEFRQKAASLTSAVSESDGECDGTALALLPKCQTITQKGAQFSASVLLE